VQWVLRQCLMWSFLISLLIVPRSAWAISITFDVVPLGGQMYRYEYSVFNDGSLGVGVAVELFDILFNPSLYDEMSLTFSPPPDPPAAEWSEMILQIVPGLPPAYDVEAIGGGIPVGATVAGFAVEFIWLGGPAGPGSQPFQIVHRTSFDVLEEGQTVPQQTIPIPEPRTLLLLGSSLTVLVWRKHRRRHVHS
jgi:hypothetical protein